jgi:hypothetical protein
MPEDETSESSCGGCDNGTARESGRKFAGPDEFRDDDVVIWFPNQVFEKSEWQGATSRKGSRPFAFVLILLAMRAVACVAQQSFKCVSDS